MFLKYKLINDIKIKFNYVMIRGLLLKKEPLLIRLQYINIVTSYYELEFSKWHSNMIIVLTTSLKTFNFSRIS